MQKHYVQMYDLIHLILYVDSIFTIGLTDGTPIWAVKTRKHSSDR